MPAKVLLTAVHGPLTGTKYRFDEQMLCMVGRGANCMLQLDGDAAAGVSRHHCMLDVRPPEAFLCDLGSRNGTKLNGEKLLGTSDTRALHTGDLIRVGNNEFEIKLVPARQCSVCRKELPESELDEQSPFQTSRIICPECVLAGRLPVAQPSAKTIQFRVCSVCGARVAGLEANNGKIWRENTAAFICADCYAKQPDPYKTFRMPEIEARSGRSILPVPNYRVQRLIGRGGMGAVYLAESVKTLEKVALKILLPEIAVHEQCRDDFIREANNLKNLRHPNIVELKECASVGGALYLVLEYCTEGTLREYIRKTGQTLQIRMAVDLTCQILDALEYAHNVRLEQMSLLDAQMYHVNGLVHRDIKPSNIFLTRQDGTLTAKLSDFGLAKAFDMAGISGCTQTGDFSGTLGFIPKQQFLNYKYVKPEVDVWSACATLYYMLTGKSPRDFSGSVPVSQIFEEQPTPIRDYNPYVPEPLAELIDTALDDRESLRFRSADQLRFALRDVYH